MNRIALLRKEKGMSQLSLAMKLNVSQKMVSAYENEKSEPCIATLIRLADIFHTSVDYIIGNSNIRQPITRIEENELTKNEIELINTFRTLSIKQQNIALGVIIGLRASV